MGKRLTTLQRIQALREKCGVLGKKIDELQETCSHRTVKADHRAIGYNGYSTDYTTYCRCQDCDKSWVHDGYCVGYTHTRQKAA